MIFLALLAAGIEPVWGAPSTCRAMTSGWWRGSSEHHEILFHVLDAGYDVDSLYVSTSGPCTSGQTLGLNSIVPGGNPIDPSCFLGVSWPCPPASNGYGGQLHVSFFTPTYAVATFSVSPNSQGCTACSAFVDVSVEPVPLAVTSYPWGRIKSFYR